MLHMRMSCFGQHTEIFRDKGTYSQNGSENILQLSVNLRLLQNKK